MASHELLPQMVENSPLVLLAALEVEIVHLTGLSTNLDTFTEEC